MIADKLLSRLEKVKQCRDDPSSWTACCPAHNDRNPSLLVTQREATAERDETVLIYCRAGCGAAEVLQSVGLEFTDLYPEKPKDRTSEHDKKKHGKYSTKARRPFNAHAVLESLAIECRIVALSSQLIQQHYATLLEKIPEAELVKWFDIGLSQETHDRLVVAATRIDAGFRLANGE